MFSNRLSLVLAFAGLLGFVLVGCSGGAAPTTSGSEATDSPADDHADDGHDDHDSADEGQDEHGDHDHGDSEGSGLSGLNQDDRELALAQKLCPVSEEELGLMGTPIKVTVKGQRFLLCCDSCKEDLDDDPDRYLAALAKISAGQTADHH